MSQENQGVNYSMALKNYNQKWTQVVNMDNIENQLQVAFATIAEQWDQIDSLTRVNNQTQCLYVLRNRELQDEQTIGKKR